MTSELQRWVEDIIMNKFESGRKRYSKIALRSSALVTAVDDRIWELVTGDTPPSSNISLSSIVSEHTDALNDVGIESVEQLADADTSHLANVLELEEPVIDGWIQQAERMGTESTRSSLRQTENARHLRQQYDRITGVTLTTVTNTGTRVVETLQTEIIAVSERSGNTESAKSASQWLRRQLVSWVVIVEMSVIAMRDSDPVSVDTAVSSQAWRSSNAPSEADMTRLSTVGVESVAQLAAADSNRLAVVSGIDAERITQWIETARMYEMYINDD